MLSGPTAEAALLDMTLCTGGACPKKRDCLRHRQRACGRRNTFGSPPFQPQTGDCDAFVHIETVAPTEAQIRTRAYHLWQEAGCPEGRDLDHWTQAAETLAARYRERLTE